jgi:hypothetical protein
MLFGIHESSISEYFLETSFFGFMQPIWRHHASKHHALDNKHPTDRDVSQVIHEQHYDKEKRG